MRRRETERSAAEPIGAAVDNQRAVQHLMDLLAVEGLSGQEGGVAALVRSKLRDAGVKTSWMRHDRAHERIGQSFEIGNLIVELPGSIAGARRLFSCHMDTVPLCRGAVPVRRGGRIIAKGKTALGGDDRTGVACLVTLAASLLRNRLPHPPLTLLFTVGEEVGLLGARHVSVADLARPKLGFNFDGGPPATVTIGAVSAVRWEAEVFGRSAHAGLHPEAGVSSVLIASRAIERVSRRGYFGKIVKGKKRGTANVGIIRGGEATNQVTDHVYVKGECRSRDPKFVGTIVEAYREAFQDAARSVRNDRGRAGRVRFRPQHDYDAFLLEEDDPVVLATLRSVEALGMKPTFRITAGGLDANWLNGKGIPTVTLGAGQHEVHTTDEYVDVDEYLGGCRLAVGLACA